MEDSDGGPTFMAQQAREPKNLRVALADRGKVFQFAPRGFAKSAAHASIACDVSRRNRSISQMG
jgi:hypothetical protein